MKKWVVAGMLVMGSAPSLAWGHANDPGARRLFDLGASWMWDTTFGPMTSDAPNQYVCEEAFLGGENYRIAPVSTTTWYTASAAGLMQTKDGCDFTLLEALEETPVSLEVFPSTGRLLMLQNAKEGADALRWSDDEGKAWSSAALPGEDVQWTAARFLSADEVVISGYQRKSEPGGLSVLLKVALDTGEVTSVPGVEDMTYLYVHDAHDGAFVGAAGEEGGLRIVHGEPGAQIARDDLGAWPTGMVFEPESGDLVVTVSLPDPEGGFVLRGVKSEDGARTWSRQSEGHSARCVGAWSGDVFLCARRDREMHDVTKMSDNAAFLTFQKLEGPRTTCAPTTDVGRICPMVWEELARALQVEGYETPDMGTPDQGGPDMGGMSDMDRDTGEGNLGSPGGCATSGVPTAPGWGWFVVALMGWFGRRSRIRSR